VRSRTKRVTGTGTVKKRIIRSKPTIDKPKHSKPGKVERYVK
jgi:hypothetical protein